MWFVVDEDNVLRGVYTNQLVALAESCPDDVVLAVSNNELGDGSLSFVLDYSTEDYTADPEAYVAGSVLGDVANLEALAEEQAIEIEELYQRVASMEEDFYGAEQPLLEATLDLGNIDDDGNFVN